MIRRISIRKSAYRSKYQYSLLIKITALLWGELKNLKKVATKSWYNALHFIFQKWSCWPLLSNFIIKKNGKKLTKKRILWVKIYFQFQKIQAHYFIPLCLGVIFTTSDRRHWWNFNLTCFLCGIVSPLSTIRNEKTSNFLKKASIYPKRTKLPKNMKTLIFMSKLLYSHRCFTEKY